MDPPGIGDVPPPPSLLPPKLLAGYDLADTTVIDYVKLDQEIISSAVESISDVISNGASGGSAKQMILVNKQFWSVLDPSITAFIEDFVYTLKGNKFALFPLWSSLYKRAIVETIKAECVARKSKMCYFSQNISGAETRLDVKRQGKPPASK
uniref:(California timema) hypothetical protein n=1 Tax=Timema californicum TaxID=61474 RepID=A0A7R9JDQ5_TIMCA|nr:unnamed protein product [Timema californicum]